MFEISITPSQKKMLEDAIEEVANKARLRFYAGDVLAGEMFTAEDGERHIFWTRTENFIFGKSVETGKIRMFPLEQEVTPKGHAFKEGGWSV